MSDTLLKALQTMNERLERIEGFVSRRFDEISAEIDATSQQMDMTEAALGSQFSNVLEALRTLSFEGQAATPNNTGVELAAVIKVTEDAANKILDAADRIATRIDHDEIWDTQDGRTTAREAIAHDINDILLACSFQDLASQRISMALNNLNIIEDQINETLEKLGITTEINQQHFEEQVQAGASQDDIDALFGDIEE